MCTGELQPTPISARYRVEIRLPSNERPRARILSPPLERRTSPEPIPHTWGPDEPCFYYPVAREWMRSMPLSTSVVPWLGLWLIHYEGWRATGHWEGGGVAHAPRRREHHDHEGGGACPAS